VSRVPAPVSIDPGTRCRHSGGKHAGDGGRNARRLQAVTLSELLLAARAATALESNRRCRRRSTRSSHTIRPVYVRDEIVRNHHVVATLRERGAVCADELGEAVPGARRLLRSRRLAGGARRCRACGLRTIDATGPVAMGDPREALDIAADTCTSVWGADVRFILPRTIRQTPAAQAG
jgi:hypothetical protein